MVGTRQQTELTPSILRKKLASEGVLVVTVNNKPRAVTISLSDENSQDNLLFASRLLAQIAVHSIRNQAHKDGMDKTTLKEVNALIKRTRAEQNKISKGTGH